MALPLGEYNEQGEVITDPQVCAVTGHPFTPGDATIRVPGTRHFFHVKAAEKRRMTPQERQALIDQAIAQVTPPSRAKRERIDAEAPKGE